MVKFEPNMVNLFLPYSRHKLVSQYMPRLRKCVESLTEEQIWWRPNESSNSIGNLILHLNGNVRQWLVDSFNHSKDERDRPAEFAAKGDILKAKLLEMLEWTVREAANALDRMSEAELLAQYEIQGYTVYGLDAVYQVIEHFALHYGQIVYIAKMLRDQDLGFYKELDSTGRAAGQVHP
jgi:hypothetical protein